jgi:hypothetical protein
VADQCLSDLRESETLETDKVEASRDNLRHLISLFRARRDAFPRIHPPNPPPAYI